MSRVFISYARSDDKFAGRLADDLRANGFDIWRDVDDIPVGVEWDGVINTALKQSDTMLLIISPQALVDENVEHQWKHFLTRNKKIILLLLSTAELPSALKHLHSIDFQQNSTSYKFGSPITNPHQQAFCRLQTAICDQRLSASNRIISTTQHSNLSGRMTILVAIVLSSVLLSALFAPIVTSGQKSGQQSQSVPPPTSVSVTRGADTSSR